eukprot:Opistho-2@88653
MYRHALPPGFVLKKDKNAMEDAAEEISLEELIETQRAALGERGKLTPVTFDSFTAWKKARKERESAERELTNKKKEADFKSGKALGVSGRDLFMFKPELFEDDADAADDTVYARRSEDDILAEEAARDAASAAAHARELEPDADEDNNDEAGPSGSVEVDEDLFNAADDLENLDLEDDE